MPSSTTTKPIKQDKKMDPNPPNSQTTIASVKEDVKKMDPNPTVAGPPNSQINREKSQINRENSQINRENSQINRENSQINRENSQTPYNRYDLPTTTVNITISKIPAVPAISSPPLIDPMPQAPTTTGGAGNQDKKVTQEDEIARLFSRLLVDGGSGRGSGSSGIGEGEWWQGHVVQESGKENYSVAYHDAENNMWYFPCPRCFGIIQMLQSELNCRIFRHGEINPHANQQTCDQFAQDTQLKRGCGTPLQFNNNNGTVHITSYNS
jgi:hypothetical protein